MKAKRILSMTLQVIGVATVVAFLGFSSMVRWLPMEEADEFVGDCQELVMKMANFVAIGRGYY